ncbi:hypothetical protein [Singulisphaera sp. PoT]|uniref:hypothetical protein n=1 Tax=Singulisphaera sp. PoT TaxID=3411797 RepID=UPI003BF4AB10
MPQTKASNDPIERRLYDHCLGSGDPSGHLLDAGTFPPGWVRRFDELLSEARARWGAEPSLPKTLVSALFFASFFPQYRYRRRAATRPGQGTQQAERDMAHLRSVSSLFLFAGLPRAR